MACVMRLLCRASRQPGVWTSAGVRSWAPGPRIAASSNSWQLSSSSQPSLLHQQPAAAARWHASSSSSSRLQPPSTTAAAASAREADADAIGDLGDSDEFLDQLEDFEEDVGAEVATGGVPWGEAALAAVQRLLEQSEDLALYSFRALPSSRRLDVRLDKLTNVYGSPSLDDIEAFTRDLTAELEASLGAEPAGEIEVEVSSAGAERQVRVPSELDRFAELPMRVEFLSTTAAAAAVAATPESSSSSASNSSDEGTVESKVLQFESYDEAAGLTRWRLADVRVNRATAGKGRGLTRKQREQVWQIPLSALRRVNLHLDI